VTMKPLLMALMGGAIAAPLAADAEDMPALRGVTEWVNSPPLTTSSLRGKVVLVDFWTYSCINWLRTLPHVRAWAEKYKDSGLVVIGVHSPEFDFEKNVEDVRRAVQEMQIAYPVAIDSDHAVWRAFRNQYWPALYLVDANGKIRHRLFGEGDYEGAEKILRQLLAEAGHERRGEERTDVDARGLEVAADWHDLRSPETYLGFQRTENFASPRGAVFGKRRLYEAPTKLMLNHWALAGEWTMGSQSAVLHAAGGRIAFRFHARDLHLVLGPAADGKPVRFRVLIDGKPPGATHGVDVDEKGNGTVTWHRLYQLIRQPKPIDDRLFEIEFLDPGVHAFVFTFG
jgi:thiol-disulfide isomerase/thioredoxin